MSNKELSKLKYCLHASCAECIKLYLSAAEDDVYEVLGEVIDLQGIWTNVLAGLRLPPSKLSIIKAEHSTNSRSCLQAALLAWLSKTYNVEKHGPPSWRTLVKAVADPIGGANVSLALKIADNHPGKVHIIICTQYRMCSVVGSNPA